MCTQPARPPPLTSAAQPGTHHSTPTANTRPSRHHTPITSCTACAPPCPHMAAPHHPHHPHPWNTVCTHGSASNSHSGSAVRTAPNATAAAHAPTAVNAEAVAASGGWHPPLCIKRPQRQRGAHAPPAHAQPRLAHDCKPVEREALQQEVRVQAAHLCVNACVCAWVCGCVGLCVTHTYALYM